MDDATDHSPIIDARLAPCVGRKTQGKLRELSITQPKILSLHQ
jgi:hypothetical protein